MQFSADLQGITRLASLVAEAQFFPIFFHENNVGIIFYRHNGVGVDNNMVDSRERIT